MPKYFRNAEAMWREEDLSKEEAMKGLETGEDVSEIGTSIILFQGKMHAINILGTEIWKLCEGRTSEDIVFELSKYFEVELPVLEADVNAFLQNMKELGLVYEE
ncbi:MAG: GeoRSP system PqqD family protein [Nitrospirae bacterium GWC2_42_7]|nr:MAG: GeoRSP system PqqD family protein [Nitrospirae bacterium GWC2_42_7]